MPLLLPSGLGPGLVTGRLFRMANGNAAYVSATVAGAAVVVSGVMQYLTLRRAKEDAERTITATERTARMTALSSATTVGEQGLREDLAEFATLTYEVESAFK
jgi:hypothetical protein